MIAHSALLTRRSLVTLWRQPAYAAMTLIQPIIWLLLFGQLFKAVVEIPGFASGATYLEFITPGVIVMTALFSSGWAGTVYIEDMNRGVMDRLLASPVKRGAMMIGTLAYQAVTTVVQTLTVLAIAYAAGARFPGGLSGVLVTLAAAVLISVIHRASAPVRLLRDHGHAAGAGVGAGRRELQPGRLGGGRRPRGAAREPGLGRHLAPARDARSARGADGVAGDARVRRLPALAMSRAGCRAAGRCPRSP